MPETTAGVRFDPELSVEDLPKPVLVELWQRTAGAHEHLFHLWQDAVQARFGEEAMSELEAAVAPGLAAGRDLREVFFDDWNTLAAVVKAMPGMLTVAEYQDEVLSAPLTAELDPEALSNRALALLWNVAALAYMFVTNRWYEAAAARFGDAAARSLEKEVWLDRGAAEDDLKIGLEAARATGRDVESLLKGFQLAPGEVGLLEVDFDLRSADHGWLIHRRCPAWDRFGTRDSARREHSCVICVIGMRLSGEMIDPRIRCRPASLPPYPTPRGYACKWEYWQEGGAVADDASGPHGGRGGLRRGGRGDSHQQRPLLPRALGLRRREELEIRGAAVHELAASGSGLPLGRRPSTLLLLLPSRRWSVGPWEPPARRLACSRCGRRPACWASASSCWRSRWCGAPTLGRRGAQRSRRASSSSFRCTSPSARW